MRSMKVETQPVEDYDGWCDEPDYQVVIRLPITLRERHAPLSVTVDDTVTVSRLSERLVEHFDTEVTIHLTSDEATEKVEAKSDDEPDEDPYW